MIKLLMLFKVLLQHGQNTL